VHKIKKGVCASQQQMKNEEMPWSTIAVHKVDRQNEEERSIRVSILSSQSSSKQNHQVMVEQTHNEGTNQTEQTTTMMTMKLG
jgi:alpha-L-arabinofuranosidase